ncbi:type II toxin-antitoxin system RelE/ParE family toxin [Phyllobacterium sp. SB3]|uniref:type II toxin-antitoxin system RelE/ParE family toxin n=1 Tax=Phyllobacterium sp. SB3 TaxID=3156073 RepID=UPI0032AEBCA8
MADKSAGYKLSPLAENDLENIWLYTFENWSAKQADTYHITIIESFSALAKARRTGCPVDIREGYFKHAVGSHVIYYKLLDAEIAIIRVLHQRMDVNRHL